MSRRSEPIERRDVERELGRRVPDRVWEFMVAENYLSEAEQEGGLPWIKEKCLMLLGPRGKDNEANEVVIKRTRRQRRNATVPLRREATSCLLAAIARNDDRVKAFRGKYLPGGLLKPDNVESWIHASEHVGRFLHAIVLSLPNEMDLTSLRLKSSSEIPARLLQGNRMERLASVDCLSYPDVSSGYLKKHPVWRDGTLRILYELTNDLAKLYAWNPADALMFVLTDYTPPVTLYEFTLHPSVVTETQSQTLNPIGCLSRVTITVDPFTTPREVAELYAPVRRNLLKGRPKSLNEKQMHLACFIAGHETPPRALMTQWNEKYPQWKYGRLSLFSRDSRRARAILLGEAIFDLKKAFEREPLSRISITQPS